MTADDDRPEWFILGDELLWPIIGMGVAAARAHRLESIDLQPLAELALEHHAGCVEASDYANRVESTQQPFALCGSR